MPVQVGQRGAAGSGREYRGPVGHAQGDGGVAPGQVCLALRTGKLRGLRGVFHCPGLLGCVGTATKCSHYILVRFIVSMLIYNYAF
ncbi:hypothetical protein D3C72_2102070 [compost metagenome]